MANPAYGTESAPMKVHYPAAVVSIADDFSLVAISPADTVAVVTMSGCAMTTLRT